MYEEDRESNVESYEEDASIGEGEATQETEDGDTSEGDTLTLTKAELDQRLAEARKEQDKRWKERIKSKGGEERRGTDDRFERLELKTEGYTSKQEQDVILEYARFKKIDVTEALKSPAIKAEIAEIRAKASVPAPSSRTSNGVNNSIDYHIAQAKKGIFPTDPEIRRQLRKMRIFSK